MACQATGGAGQFQGPTTVGLQVGPRESAITLPPKAARRRTAALPRTCGAADRRLPVRHAASTDLETALLAGARCTWSESSWRSEPVALGTAGS